jgi:hypothetical protein
MTRRIFVTAILALSKAGSSLRGCKVRGDLDGHR